MGSEADVVVGPEFGEEGGDGEFVEGVEAGGGAHCVDGGGKGIGFVGDVGNIGRPGML